MTEETHPLLLMSLQLAVPTALAEIARLAPEERARLARRAADQLASHGDDLLYEGPHCRATFAALARSLAAAAFVPGGVTHAGLHWCVRGHRHCPAPTAARHHARLCGIAFEHDEDPVTPGGHAPAP